MALGFFKNLSFRLKISVLITLSTVTVITIICACLIFFELSTFKKDLGSERTNLLNIVSANIAAAVIFDDTTVIEETLSVFDALPDLQSAILFDVDGNVVSLYQPAPTVAEGSAPALMRDVATDSIAEFTNGLIVAQVPVYFEADILGSLQVTTSLQKLEAKIANYLLITAIAIGVAVWLAIILGWRFGRYLTRPIDALTKAMAEVQATSNYQQKVTVQTDDELGRLADRFNEMLLEIQQRDDRLHRRSEELLQEKENAEAASKSKSEFLANMSHELRTPMNGVLGMAEILMATELSDRQKIYADTIYRSGAALTTILNDILDFSKIEAGKLELLPAPFNPAKAVDDVMVLLRSSADDRKISLEATIDHPLPAWVEGDVGRIRQVLTNLVGNAIKFTREGGVHVHVSGSVTDGALALEVAIRDTGIGIAADKLEVIFQKFTQAEGTTTREFGGTGLGLAITRSLADAMHGSIRVDSRPGAGSTFWFNVTLPVVAEGVGRHGGDGAANGTAEKPVPVTAAPQRPVHQTPVHQTPAHQTPAQAKTRRILVAEDNQVNRMVVDAMIDKSLYAIYFAEDGREACDLYKTDRFDLVFMDISMPRMDGVDATRAIRAFEAESGMDRTPIIALTAHAMSGDEERFREAGMDAYMAKPVQKDLIARMLEQWTGNARATPPASGSKSAARASQ